MAYFVIFITRNMINITLYGELINRVEPENRTNWLDPVFTELCGLKLEQSRADGEFDQLGAGMQVQLVHDPLAVPGDRLRAQT